MSETKPFPRATIVPERCADATPTTHLATCFECVPLGVRLLLAGWEIAEDRTAWVECLTWNLTLAAIAYTAAEQVLWTVREYTLPKPIVLRAEPLSEDQIARLASVLREYPSTSRPILIDSEEVEPDVRDIITSARAHAELEKCPTCHALLTPTTRAEVARIVALGEPDAEAIQDADSGGICVTCGASTW